MSDKRRKKFTSKIILVFQPLDTSEVNFWTGWACTMYIVHAWDLGICTYWTIWFCSHLTLHNTIVGCTCLFSFAFQAYLLGCSFDSFDTNIIARSYVYVMSFLAWFLPLSIIASKYYKIVSIVRQNNFLTQNMSVEEERVRELEKSLFRMVLLILGVWIFAWTPYLVLHCWIMFGDLDNLTVHIAIAPTLCCKLSAAVNAFLYGVR